MYLWLNQTINPGEKYKMRNNKIIIFLIVVAVGVLVSSAYWLIDRNAIITDARIAAAIDEKLMPIKVTDTFPPGTSKVYCWIKWQDAKINTQIVAKWHYITDDIPINEYVFVIPKRNGTGSVSLSMPAGKMLPSGLYKVSLLSGRRVLKSLTFTIE